MTILYNPKKQGWTKRLKLILNILLGKIIIFNTKIE